MSGLFRALHRTKVFRNLTEQEFAWVLYDVGNSAFIMLACSLIPIWFKSLAIGTGPGKISSDQATAYYSIAISIVTVVVALIGPVCGVLADRKDKKKIFFTTTAGLGITGCVLNGVATSWVLFLVIYIVTRVCYNASLTIYDSMLNDVTTEERMDEVSSYGYAWGYLGSCIPFLVALIAYVLGPDMVGVLPDFVSKMIGFGGGDAAVAEGISAEELRGNENGYRRSDIWKNIQNPEKNRSFGPESIFLSDWILSLY